MPGMDDVLGDPPSMASAKAAGWMPPPAYLTELAEAARRDEASFSQVFMAGMLVRDDATSTWWSRLKNWLATRRARIVHVTADPVTRTPRAGDVDAFVWWKVLHFDSQDATELLAEIASLRDRITTFL